MFKSVGARPAKAAEVERATGLPAYALGKPYTSPGVGGADPARLVRDTYDRVTWCFACVDAIARNQAGLPVEVRRDDRHTGDLVPGHPLLPLLNFKSSPEEHAFAFRYRLSGQVLTSPRGAFVEVVRSRRGEPVALRLLPPGSTRAIPDPTTFVSGYEVRLGARTWTLPPESVLWVRRPHPVDPYRSMTPAEAAGLAIDVEWLSSLYNRNFLRNDGKPGGLIAVSGSLLPEDADEIKSYFASGARPGEWRVVEADGLTVTDLSTSPRDAQYVEARGLAKTEILVAYGVPETVLGNASGRTFDNADAEKEVFWQETMLPHLHTIAAGLDTLDDDPTTWLAFEVGEVEALQRAALRRRTELRDEYERGLITIDEYREATGREPFGFPGSRVPYVSVASVALDSVGTLGNPARPTLSVVNEATLDVAARKADDDPDDPFVRAALTT